MFDKDLKDNFIKTARLEYGEDMVKIREWLLNSINNYEDTVNKSILDMTKNEIKEFFISLNGNTMATIDGAFSQLKNYILLSGETHRNAFFSINLFERKELSKLIDNNANYQRHITISEYEVYCERECNAQDTALLILLWNGVYSSNKERYSDIIDIKVKQFDFSSRKLKLIDGRVITFTERENQLLQLAINEQYYRKYNDDDTLKYETPYLEGEYFIKHTSGTANKDSDNNQTPIYTISLRLTRYFKKIGASFLTGYSVYLSGLIYRCLEDNDFNQMSVTEMKKQLSDFDISVNKITEAKKIIEDKLIKEGYASLKHPNQEFEIEEVMQKYHNKEVNYKQGAELLNIGQTTFSRYYKKYKESKGL